MAGSIPTRRQWRWSFFQKLSYLRLTAVDARQRFNRALRFFDRRGRMGAKVRFQRRVMFLPGTLRSLDRDFFQSLDAAREIELEILPQRVLGAVHSLRDLPMR